MKILKNFIGLAAIALCLGFASCSSDDDAPSYSEVQLTILSSKPFSKAKDIHSTRTASCSLTTKQTAPHLSTFQAQRLIPLP